MKLITTALLLCAAAPAFAGNVPLTLDFEAAAGTYAQSIGSLYDQQGIAFTADAVGLDNNDGAGPYFSHAPSGQVGMTVFGSDATMNVARGFEGAFGFFYSSSLAIADAVQVWSGLDGTGTLLASFGLAANAQAGGCSDTSYCNFSSVSTVLTGVGRSVTFGNTAFEAVFDDVSLNVVPEPSTALLLPLALAGLLATRRRASA
ncbi:MAG: PEP-CTERM sorting domain-containing protein [Rubrivivax sp.]|nr:PEP-CTERM sorting domain-containing protein [Rubrivivax sp.]